MVRSPSIGGRVVDIRQGIVGVARPACQRRTTCCGECGNCLLLFAGIKYDRARTTRPFSENPMRPLTSRRVVSINLVLICAAALLANGGCASPVKKQALRPVSTPMVLGETDVPEELRGMFVTTANNIDW